jgi:hypothetical protein
VGPHACRRVSGQDRPEQGEAQAAAAFVGVDHELDRGSLAGLGLDLGVRGEALPGIRGEVLDLAPGCGLQRQHRLLREGGHRVGGGGPLLQVTDLLGGIGRREGGAALDVR